MFYRNNPFGNGFAVFCGLNEIIDYLENLASIETNEGRWVEEEKYLYAVSVLEEVIEYIKTRGDG